MRWIAIVLSLAFAIPIPATSVLAAGGGGSAGGSGAQNAINYGRNVDTEGQLGPLGATNHPRPKPSGMTATDGSKPAGDASAPAR